eukprot:c9134_g1_i2.p1 GENE.c9134_g1_i2~~c9134_g1_i2.p1  ORF type:complete len:116 (-),score=26.60 c9134_g1_i2:72-419(-)
MGNKKFVCEYCDKVFNDTIIARKRHLKSKMHQVNKRLWFDSFAGTASWEAKEGNWEPAPKKQKNTPSAPQTSSSSTPPSSTTRKPPAPAATSLPPSLRLQGQMDFGWIPFVDWGV